MKYWIAVLFCLAFLAGMAACGGDDSVSDPRISAISSLTENAVDSWAARGSSGVYGFLHSNLTATCTAAGLEKALANQPKPTAWRNTRNVTFLPQDKATAIVIVVENGADVEQNWTFELEGGTRWRVTGFPGLSECTS